MGVEARDFEYGCLYIDGGQTLVRLYSIKLLISRKFDSIVDLNTLKVSVTFTANISEDEGVNAFTVCVNGVPRATVVGLVCHDAPLVGGNYEYQTVYFPRCQITSVFNRLIRGEALPDASGSLMEFYESPADFLQDPVPMARQPVHKEPEIQLFGKRRITLRH